MSQKPEKPQPSESGEVTPTLGRPSKYRDEYAEQARKLCLLGMTDRELAEFFEVSEQTLNAWKQAHPDFLESLRGGKALADADVSAKLFHRAMGYSHPEDDIRVANGEIVITPTIKHYPPDTTAAIFWLKNRQRDKWRDKVETTLTGAEGGALVIKSTVELVHPKVEASE